MTSETGLSFPPVGLESPILAESRSLIEAQPSDGVRQTDGAGSSQVGRERRAETNQLEERPRSSLREDGDPQAGFEPAISSSGGWSSKSTQVADFKALFKTLRPSGFPYGGEVSEELPRLLSGAPTGVRGIHQRWQEFSERTGREPGESSLPDGLIDPRNCCTYEFTI